MTILGKSGGRPGMCKMLGGALVGLLVVGGLSGCRVGGEAAAAAEKPAAETSPRTQAPSAAKQAAEAIVDAAAEARERLELDAVVRFLDVYRAHGAELRVTESDAQCMSGEVLDEVGIPALRKAGAIGPGLRPARKPQKARFSPTYSDDLAAAYVRCTGWSQHVVTSTVRATVREAKVHQLSLSKDTRSCIEVSVEATETPLAVLTRFLEGKDRLARGVDNLLSWEALPCLLTPKLMTKRTRDVLDAVFVSPPSGAASCVGTRSSAQLLESHNDRIFSFDKVKRYGRDVSERAFDKALTKAVNHCLDSEALTEHDVMAGAGSVPASIEACIRATITKEAATRMIVAAYRSSDALDELSGRVRSCA